MSGYLHEIKQNDRLPIFSETLVDASGNAIDLTGCTAKLQMRDKENTLVLDTALTIDDAEAGEVSYAWAAVDTQYAGEYLAEIEITVTESGKTRTFPENDYINIVIYPDLGSGGD